MTTKANEVIAAQDLISNYTKDGKPKINAKKGTRLEIISIHDDVYILNNKGVKFSARVEKLITTL